MRVHQRGALRCAYRLYQKPCCGRLSVLFRVLTRLARLDLSDPQPPRRNDGTIGEIGFSDSVGVFPEIGVSMP